MPQVTQRRQLLDRTQHRAALRLTPTLRLVRRILHRGLTQVLELLQGVLQLALLAEQILQRVTQINEHVNVQQRIVQPGLRQGAARPVFLRVLLRQLIAEQLLNGRTQVHALQTGKTRPKLRIEQAVRAHTEHVQAREVLNRGVNNPLSIR